jgi:glycosyltransferase involved in cell wall biosynthesis
VSPPRRAALISNLCPHYRRPLYELLAQRMRLECFFFAEQESYWNASLPAVELGQFTHVPMRRISILGEPLLPALFGRLTLARYDVVIVSLVGRLMLPYAYAAARIHGLPFVLWTGVWHHPQTPFHRITQPFTRSLYRRADAIVVYGDHVRAALREIAGVDDAKIFTAAQAVDGELFSVPSDPATSREILFIGRFEEDKGLRDLMAAFALIDDATLRLSLVGDGSLEAELRAHAARDKRIRVFDSVPQEQLVDRLAAARCVVLPSTTTKHHKETWGLVVNEAMHAGLPVVVTEAVGAAAAGLVLDGVTGIVVRERDPLDLASALRTLAADDALVATMGKQGQERVATNTFDAMADAFEEAVRYAETHRH